MFHRLVALQRPMLSGIRQLAQPRQPPLPPWFGAPTLSLGPATQRYRRSFAVGALKRDGDSLLGVPGIGRRTADLLGGEDVHSTAALRQVYEQKLNGDREEFLSYLSKVGVRARWRTKIADWVDEHKEEADKITFCVEGNIASGKSTYLDMVNQSNRLSQRRRSSARPAGGPPQTRMQRQTELRHLIEVVPEPVDQWQDVGGANLLDEFYKDPMRYAYTFQSYVFVTRMMQEKKSRASTAGMRLIERSVFCDRMVFVKAVYEAQHMNDLELKVYDSWFNPMLQMHPDLTPDGFVYLQTDPDTCMRRLRMRGRSEEGTVQDSYLSRLQDFHDHWLVQGANNMTDLLGNTSSQRLDNGQTVIKTTNTLFPGSESHGASLSMLELDQQQSLIIPQVPKLLEGNIVLLDKSRLAGDTSSSMAGPMSSLHMVPALHIDCNEDIDTKDQDMMLARSDAMSEYRKWVGEYRTANKVFFNRKRVQDAAAEAASGAANFERIHEQLRRAGNAPSGSLEALERVMGH